MNRQTWIFALLLCCGACGSSPETKSEPREMRVLLLAHRVAGELVLELPLARQDLVGAQVSVDARRNALVVRGPRSAVAALCAEIEERDVAVEGPR